MANAQFSVTQFFSENCYETVRERVSPEEAMAAVSHYINNPAAKIGITRRVIVTDGGDCICFEWKFGEGIVFPPKENDNAEATV